MSKAYPIPSIVGFVNSFVDVDVPIGSLLADSTSQELMLVVADAPTAGNLVAEVRTAPNGGGEAITVTMAQGTTSRVAFGVLSISAGTELYLRVKNGASAITLSGYLRTEETTRCYPVPTIAGLVSSHLAQDFSIAVMESATSITRVVLTATDPPSTGDLTAEIRNPAGGTLPVTILQGERSGEATGSLPFTASEIAALRVTADGFALNLSGFIETDEVSTNPIYPIATLAGRVEDHVSTDTPVAVFDAPHTLERVSLTAIDGPIGGSLVASVRTATGGLGNGITATIPSGFRSAEAFGSVYLPQGTFYLRPTIASLAQNLSGWIEVAESQPIVIEGDDLTTLELVKQHSGITTNQFDLLLQSIITQVSDQMRQWMGRNITPINVAGEKHSATRWDTQVFLTHYPIQTVDIVSENGNTLSPDAYEVELETGVITKMAGSGSPYYPTPWMAGYRNIEITYTGGYLVTPPDLTLAATEEARHRWHQTQPSGRDALGLNAKTLDTGGQSSYVPGDLLDSTKTAMWPYRRLL